MASLNALLNLHYPRKDGFYRLSLPSFSNSKNTNQPFIYDSGNVHSNVNNNYSDGAETYALRPRIIRELKTFNSFISLTIPSKIYDFLIPYESDGPNKDEGSKNTFSLNSRTSLIVQSNALISALYHVRESDIKLPVSMWVDIIRLGAKLSIQLNEIDSSGLIKRHSNTNVNLYEHDSHILSKQINSQEPHSYPKEYVVDYTPENVLNTGIPIYQNSKEDTPINEIESPLINDSFIYFLPKDVSLYIKLVDQALLEDLFSVAILIVRSYVSKFYNRLEVESLNDQDISKSMAVIGPRENLRLMILSISSNLHKKKAILNISDDEINTEIIKAEELEDKKAEEDENNETMTHSNLELLHKKQELSNKSQYTHKKDRVRYKPRYIREKEEEEEREKMIKEHELIQLRKLIPNKTIHERNLVSINEFYNDIDAFFDLATSLPFIFYEAYDSLLLLVMHDKERGRKVIKQMATYKIFPTRRRRQFEDLLTGLSVVDWDPIVIDWLVANTPEANSILSKVVEKFIDNYDMASARKIFKKYSDVNVDLDKNVAWNAVDLFAFSKRYGLAADLVKYQFDPENEYIGNNISHMYNNSNHIHKIHEVNPMPLKTLMVRLVNNGLIDVAEQINYLILEKTKSMDFSVFVIRGLGLRNNLDSKECIQHVFNVLKDLEAFNREIKLPHLVTAFWSLMRLDAGMEDIKYIFDKIMANEHIVNRDLNDPNYKKTMIVLNNIRIANLVRKKDYKNAVELYNKNKDVIALTDICEGLIHDSGTQGMAAALDIVGGIIDENIKRTKELDGIKENKIDLKEKLPIDDVLYAVLFHGIGMYKMFSSKIIPLLVSVAQLGVKLDKFAIIVSLRTAKVYGLYDQFEQLLIEILTFQHNQGIYSDAEYNLFINRIEKFRASNKAQLRLDDVEDILQTKNENEEKDADADVGNNEHTNDSDDKDPNININ